MPELPPVENRRYNYTVSGADIAAPYEVFDDGATTYFRYNPPLSQPPLVGLPGKNGEELAASVYQNGDYFAVDTVSNTLLLHVPSGTAYVFKEKNPAQ